MDKIEEKEEKESEPNFEESLEELESIVEELERGQLTLEESLEKFEQGTRLAGLCNQKLEKVERRVEQLIEKNGEIITEPFMEDE